MRKWLNKLGIGSSGNRMLVMGFDGTVIRGAVADSSSGQVILDRAAEVVATDDLAACVEALVQRLTPNRSPMDAVVLTTEAHAALIELPAKPGSPPPPDEMVSMVRWELEAYLPGGGSASAADMSCGWAGQTSGSDGDSRDLNPWLVASLPIARRDAWRKALEKVGVNLRGIYPWHGSSLGLVPADSRDFALVELHSHSIACVVVQGGVVQSIRAVDIKGVMPSVADVARMLGPVTVKEIWLTGGDDIAAEQLGPLAGRLNAPLKTLEPKVAGALPEGTRLDWAGPAGVVAHCLGIVPASRCASVLPDEPLPPAWKRPSVWWTTAAVVAGLVVLTTEFMLWKQRRQLISETDDIRREATKLKRAMAEMIDLNQKTIAQVATNSLLREEILRSRSKIQLLGESLQLRHAYVTAVFNSLALAASEDVVVNRVVETETRGLVVQAWSRTETSAQQFGKLFIQGMRRWDLVSDSPRVMQAPGRFDRPGYAVEINLVPASPTTPGPKGK